MNLNRSANLFILIFSPFLIVAQISYPKTVKIPKINIYHSIDIVDNYQWLENTETQEVKDWVNQQNKISKKYLNRLVKSNSTKGSMKEFTHRHMQYDDITLPKRNRNYYYRIMYPGENSPKAIYYSKGNYDSYQKLVSANSISGKDQIVFTNLIPSEDDRFLAYQYNRNGSDWKEIKIVQMKKRHYFKETLRHTISSEIYWFGQGFFYKKYPFDSTQGRRIFPEIMYHKLGTEQNEDLKIFNVKSEEETLQIYGTARQSLFIIKKSNPRTNKFSYYYIRPKNTSFDFKPLFIDIKYDMQILRYEADTVIALTEINNKNFLISFPITTPKKWALLSPSYDGAVLTDFEVMDTKIVTSFQTETSSIIAVTDHKGEILGELVTPEGLSVSNLKYSKDTDNFYFKLSSYTIPPVTCQLDLNNYTFKYLGKVEVSFNAKNYKFIRKKFKSHDGTEVPLFIVYKDSLNKNGDTPFLLKTYGGYGVIAKPTFNPGAIYFIENGGAFAYVHVRGGGEFGNEWREQGKKLNKKNSILDFSGAAEHLISEGYTKPKKIAAMGGSHGGLIVAAAIIEKPEIFGTAVIDVGVLDMLRFERSVIGSTYTNLNEFGSVKNEEEFKNLYSYSPYHNLDATINYPSMLIMTGSHDTRVPPHHSYKFAAKLQSGTKQKNPILLWSQNETGHFGANEYNAIYEELAFTYSFLLQELQK